MNDLTSSSDPLVEIRDLSVHFQSSRNRSFFQSEAGSPLRAVDGVSMAIGRGEIVGLVGESGSGKTTLARAILGLSPIARGGVFLAGDDITKLPPGGGHSQRRGMQMIPQDAAASLSPRFKVFQLLKEAYDISGRPEAERKSVTDLLAMVELGPEHADKYPHELSGGQARRVSIARALVMEPDLIVADEPTAGLDVSAVATIVNLLARLRQELGLSYLLITHDLEIVAYLADLIAVMYLGKIVEIGPAEDIVDSPRHPYTRSLLQSIVRPGSARGAMFELKGDPPDPLNPPLGCRFHTRCYFARSECRTQEPLRLPSGENRETACHFWRDIEKLDPVKTNTVKKETSR